MISLSFHGITQKKDLSGYGEEKILALLISIIFHFGGRCDHLQRKARGKAG